MLTSRCKHFGVHETVPRHGCSIASCEFESLENCRRDLVWWLNFEAEGGYKEGTFSAEYKRKLEYAEKVAAMLDKSSKR